MRTWLTSTCAAALLLAGNLAVAQKTDSAVNSDQTTATSATTSTREIVYGKVKAYNPGKSLKVSVPGNFIKTKKIDLHKKNETVNVASNVKVGDWVRVQQTKDNYGHKTLTVKESNPSS